MRNLIESMEQESECTEVIYQSYIASRSQKEVFLFFEGKDDFKYYFSRISPYIGSKSYGKYCCNSKNNVVKLHDMISKKTSDKYKNKVLYFVDRDFDNNELISKDIYVTSLYSIENYYFTDNAIKNIIYGIMGISDEISGDKEDFRIAFDILIKKREEIIEEIIYGNAWYSLQIKKSDDKEKVPNLSSIKEYDKIKNLRKIIQLKELVPNAIELDEIEILNEIEEIREKPLEKIRGKYFLQSLSPFFKKIFQDIGKSQNREFFPRRRKIKFNLSDLLNEFSCYAETPNELNEYISKHFLCNNLGYLSNSVDKKV
ncbi:DUF4435 domain-containing protein [Fusobacterium animalis]|nr:DUF4435 domain-containing protein [Fusobacterium nucleatum]